MVPFQSWNFTQWKSSVSWKALRSVQLFGCEIRGYTPTPPTTDILPRHVTYSPPPPAQMKLLDEDRGIVSSSLSHPGPLADCLPAFSEPTLCHSSACSFRSEELGYLWRWCQTSPDVPPCGRSPMLHSAHRHTPGSTPCSAFFPPELRRANTVPAPKRTAREPKGAHSAEDLLKSGHQTILTCHNPSLLKSRDQTILSCCTCSLWASRDQTTLNCHSPAS